MSDLSDLDDMVRVYMQKAYERTGILTGWVLVAISPASRQQRGVGALCGEASAPTLAEWRVRALLASSVLGHCDDLTDREARVLSYLRGEAVL